MNIEQKISKATLLLDLKSDVDRAEALLREAVAQAYTHNDVIGQVRASTVLGQLLVEVGRGDEALPLLRSVVNSRLPPGMDADIVDSEVGRAKALLDSLHDPPGSVES